MKLNKPVMKKAWKDSWPVMAGYLLLGTAFGVLMQTNGWGPWWCFFCSVFIYAGSLQFVGVSLLTTSASLVSTLFMTLLVNARHLMYGISMLKKYNHMGKAKPYLAMSLTDETYALLCTKSENDPDWKPYAFWISLFDQIYWVTGTMIGCWISSSIQFDSTGMDFSMTALFLCILVEQWKSTKDHLPVLWGIGVTIVCRILFGSGQFLIPAMIIIFVGLWIREKWLIHPENSL